jgi:hypothetical protein
MCDAIAEWTKNFFARLIETFETIGRARAAAELTRQGYHKEAKALLTDDTSN